MELLDGRFLKIRNLGEGAAGDVIEATVLKECSYAKVGEKVAIKIYKPWILNQPFQEKRIETELLTGINISSDHVVKTYEVASDSKNLFLVMEFLQGIKLSDWIEKNPLPDFNSICRIYNDILNGLSAIHNLGLIHRDIKPDNIILSKKGAVILDLGVIKNPNNSNSLTGDKFLGTIRYAAPEYLFGEDYDSKIDVYSLGAILHELVLGKPIILPNTYWSKQIVQKNGRAPLSDHNFDVKTYNRLGFKKSRFLFVVLQGSLSESDQRFELEQIRSAFHNNIWSETFLHYVDSETYKKWPHLPEDLENEVQQFLATKNPTDLRKFKDYLINATSGLTHEVWCYEGDKEYDEILIPLSNLGLITTPLVDEQLEVSGNITPLAWQLLLRGFFDNI